MFLVILLLDLSSSFRLFNGVFHGIRHVIGVHDHMAFGITGSAANGLDQGCL